MTTLGKAAGDKAPLQGDALAEAMKADKQFIADTKEGMKQIERGDNSGVTLEALKESLRSGEPTF